MREGGKILEGKGALGRSHLAPPRTRGPAGIPGEGWALSGKAPWRRPGLEVLLATRGEGQALLEGEGALRRSLLAPPRTSGPAGSPRRGRGRSWRARAFSGKASWRRRGLEILPAAHGEGGAEGLFSFALTYRETAAMDSSPRHHQLYEYL